MISGLERFGRVHACLVSTVMLFRFNSHRTFLWTNWTSWSNWNQLSQSLVGQPGTPKSTKEILAQIMEAESVIMKKKFHYDWEICLCEKKSVLKTKLGQSLPFGFLSVCFLFVMVHRTSSHCANLGVRSSVIFRVFTSHSLRRGLHAPRPLPIEKKEGHSCGMMKFG